MRSAHRILIVALGIASLGTVVTWAATADRPTVPVGAAILGIAGVLAWRTPRRSTALLAVAASALVLSRWPRGDGMAQLFGDGGVILAIGRAMQGAGALVAIGAGLALGLRFRRRAKASSAPRRGPRSRDPRRRDRAVVIGALVVLSAIGAELLAAYNDTTGRPALLLFNVVFFAILYGCPALIIREVARRAGRGWPTMVPLAAAFGLMQAGVIDQALFSDSYGDVRGWEQSLRATYVAPLGLGGYLAVNFLIGHIVFSFCAPIAVVEAMRPDLALRPWLDWRGIAVATTLWLVVAALILSDAVGSEHHASALEIAGSLAVVGALVLGALHLPRTAGPVRARTPRVRTVLALSFVATSAYAAVPETWAGVAIALAVVALGSWLLLCAAHGRDWGLAHAAAVGTGALLSRGALAFLYYPVVGETSAGRKYAHNVVMLLIVAAMSAYALRQARAGDRGHRWQGNTTSPATTHEQPATTHEHE